MKRSEKLAYLKDNHLDIFLKTRQKVLTNYLTNRQCFAVVVDLLQACTKFNNKVDAETIKLLSHLLPKGK